MVPVVDTPVLVAAVEVATDQSRNYYLPYHFESLILHHHEMQKVEPILQLPKFVN